MSNTLWVKLAAGTALLALGACSGGDGGGGGGGVVNPGTIQSNFGATFANAFNAGNNTDPIDPKPGDLPAVSLTTDPIDF